MMRLRGGRESEGRDEGRRRNGEKLKSCESGVHCAEAVL